MTDADPASAAAKAMTSLRHKLRIACHSDRARKQGMQTMKLKDFIIINDLMI